MQNKDNRKYFEVPYLPAEMLVPVSVVRASIENTEDGKHIWLESDLAKLDLNGQIDFYTLANNIKYLVSKELTNIPKLATVKKEGNNNFRLEADIAPLSDYSYFFAKKMSIDDTTHVSAFFNDSLDLIELNAFSNHIDLGKVNIDSLNIHFP